MATLHHLSSGRIEQLTGEHSIGRSSSCLLSLSDPRASGHHAMLRWTGDAWELLDLGSRNGTWVDGRSLSPGQRQLLTAGMTLGFGRPDDGWVLKTADAPELMARAADGTWTSASDGLLLLPSAEAPEAILYGDEEGRWVVEQGGTLTELPAEHAVTVGGVRWQIHPPAAAASTHTVDKLTGHTFVDLTFTFKVSQDEEDIEILVSGTAEPIEIPHRAQHYLLLTLARARAEDAAEGVAASEQGWRYADDLYTALRIPENQFNVAIFRARRHLKKAGVVGAKNIMERRRGSGQLRLGTARFVIRAL